MPSTPVPVEAVSAADRRHAPVPPDCQAPRAGGRLPLRRVSSSELMGAAREMEIEHAGAVYRLRVTSLGKLILTK
jgi:hemin uptake protein HemP